MQFMEQIYLILIKLNMVQLPWVSNVDFHVRIEAAGNLTYLTWTEHVIPPILLKKEV